MYVIHVNLMLVSHTLFSVLIELVCLGDQDDASDDHYLHPSLAPGSSRVELVG
jgi:hypothetical protein